MLEDGTALQLVSRYGYLAVLLGTMLEGETVVLVAGFLAHQGYLGLPGIMITAFAGSMISDQGIFFLSRFQGERLLARFPKITAGANRLTDRMSGHPAALYVFALCFRFLYGLRNAAPVVLGMSRMPSPAFVLLNAVGAAVWAVSFTLLGSIFAQTLERFMGDLARYELYVLGGLALLGALAALVKRARTKARAHHQ